MQPQSESPPENQLDFKNASGKEILKYLDKIEWKPEYLKKSEDVDQRVKLVLQYVTDCSECLALQLQRSQGIRYSALGLQGLYEV